MLNVFNRWNVKWYRPRKSKKYLSCVLYAFLFVKYFHHQIFKLLLHVSCFVSCSFKLKINFHSMFKRETLGILFYSKRTVSIISRDPPCKIHKEVGLDVNGPNVFKVDNFIMYSCSRNAQATSVGKPKL